jgi:DNA (cytosine-5)-methyltransferase 1
MFTFMDIFAGIGGFRLAAESLGGKCVFSSEINKQALKVYSANFGKTDPIDMTQLNMKEIPDADFVFAGPPCQSFSHVGQHKGFEDSRGTLFFNLFELIAYKKPPYLLIENVKHLVKQDKRRTFETIIRCLKNMGYNIDYRILKTSNYGLPQLRPRVYIVGYFEDVKFEWPKPVPLLYTMHDIWGGRCNKTIGYTLRQGGFRSPFGDRHNWDGYIVDGEEKRLGLREAKMMQGFPEDFEFPVVESRGIKLLGNSVPITVVQKLVQQLLKIKGEVNGKGNN